MPDQVTVQIPRNELLGLIDATSAVGNQRVTAPMAAAIPVVEEQPADLAEPADVVVRFKPARTGRRFATMIAGFAVVFFAIGVAAAMLYFRTVA